MPHRRAQTNTILGRLLGDDLELVVRFHTVLESVETFAHRRRARQTFEHRDLAAVRQELTSNVFASFLGDLEIAAADKIPEEHRSTKAVGRSPIFFAEAKDKALAQGGGKAYDRRVQAMR
jgi:hypothetical protein